MENKKLRALICTSVLAAMSIVLGKLLAINIGDTLRFSFENLPIILASVLFGPVWGGACGIVADLLGCVIKGYAIIPLITVSQCLMGIVPGLFTRYVFRSTSLHKVAISAFAAHVVGSMLVKTAALHLWYGTPYKALFATRIPTYIVVGLLEAYLCAVLVQNKAIKRELVRERGEKQK